MGCTIWTGEIVSVKDQDFVWSSLLNSDSKPLDTEKKNIYK